MEIDGTKQLGGRTPQKSTSQSLLVPSTKTSQVWVLKNIQSPWDNTRTTHLLRPLPQVLPKTPNFPKPLRKPQWTPAQLYRPHINLGLPHTFFNPPPTLCHPDYQLLDPSPPLTYAPCPIDHNPPFGLRISTSDL